MSDVNFHDYFYYDETSPSCLRWKVERRRGYKHNQIHVEKDSPAGNCESDSIYFRVSLDYKKHSIHRVIWELFNGAIPDGHRIDHYDQDTKNNKISNLRCIPNPLNNRNCSMASDNKSGVTGVSRKNDPKYPLWRATWVNTEGVKKEKCFSILKYGNDCAFNMACAYRAMIIAELNLRGQGYTGSHGLVKKQTKTSPFQPSFY